jgi:spore maturation protein CgeB
MFLAGPGWQRDPVAQASAATVAGAQYGQDLSIAIAPVTANLVLLNSDNRDTHTCRTFEVPAAGGLFVGERTPEHLDLLDDGTEALLFSGEEEMQELLGRCRSNPADVAAIAAAGYRRIVGGGHRYVDRAQEIINDVC